MGKVIASGAMSIDGYISGPGESGFEHLFAWYRNGGVTVETTRSDLVFHMTEGSARLWREFVGNLGALVVGRRTFDVTDGWGGLHPIGVPVIVMTHETPASWVADHPDSPFIFINDGIGPAVSRAKEIAAGKDVGLTAGVVAQQALDAGLLDEIWVMLAPVVLGEGRPFFETVNTAPVSFADPEVFAEAGVTHLRYAPLRPL